MNKTAKEMFEELGYVRNYGFEEAYDNDWKEKVLSYIKKEYENLWWRETINITFYFKEKEWIRNDEIKNNKINKKELKAIQKQIEELGWNNE